MITRVFDCEIAESVKNDADWVNARNGKLGCSCCVIRNSETSRPHLFDKHNLIDVPLWLEGCDIVVSFNGTGFDIPLLEGVLGTSIKPNAHYDILTHIWNALGGKRQKGYGLGVVCERTLGIGKSGNGADAPQLMRAGKWAELFDYCIHDVNLTRELYNHIVDCGWIIDTDGEKLHLEQPFDSNGYA